MHSFLFSYVYTMYIISSHNEDMVHVSKHLQIENNRDFDSELEGHLKKKPKEIDDLLS